MKIPVQFQSLGRRPYAEVLQLQLKFKEQRQTGEINDTILTVEHPRVITRGRRPSDDDFRISPQNLLAQGYAIEDAGRGGRLTYHGPGQLVAYFIMALTPRRLSIPQFVERVEEVVIRTLKNFNVEANRRLKCPGVWITQRKIASIGLAIDRGVSMHGVAININPNLEDFQVIVPCGIQDCEMTSIFKESGCEFSWQEVEACFQREAGTVF